MICKTCNKEFPNSMVINGEKKEFYTRKNCLECVPFGSHTKTKSSKIKRTEKEIKFNRVKAVQKRRKLIKENAVEYKGGCCEICGYNKYYGALEFHHLNPEEKDFSIGQKGYCRSWESVKNELDKCICVCSNCHKEIHAGII